MGRVPAEGFVLEGPVQELAERDRWTTATVQRFVWTFSTPALPEYAGRCLVDVAGGGVVAQRTTARLPRRFLPVFGEFPVVVLRTLLVAALMLTLLLLDYFYFRKLRDQEASMARCIVLTLFLAVVFVGAGAVFSDRWRFDLAELLPALGRTIFPAYYLSLGHGLAIVFALVLGLAWCRCESDVREYFPKKLTALDTLLSGRIVSYNVARAFLLGAALAGWAMALNCMVWRLWRGQPGAGPGLNQLEVLVAYQPGLSALFLPLTKAISHTLLGLLMPLPFIYRWTRGTRFSQQHYVLGILTLILTLYFTLDATLSKTPHSPAAGLFLTAVVATAALLVPFMLFDVLTAFFTVLVSRVVMLIFYLWYQPDATLRAASMTASMTALLTVLVALVVVLFSRRISSEEVRPIYAENLEGRLKLQARVEAAQKAERRMLPGSEPQLPGGSVACSYRSVYEQGGDYHDYFPLSGDRLGILLAEFAGHPLQAAVAIPLLKGYLLSYTRRHAEPAAVLRQLERQLEIPPEAIRSIVFLIVDAHQRTLEHARLGAEPPILLRREASAEILRLRSPDAHSAAAAREQLAAGDALLLSTPRTVDNFDERTWENDLAFGLRLAVRLSPSRKAQRVLTIARALVAPAGTLMVVCWNRQPRAQKRPRRAGSEDPHRFGDA